MYQMKAVITVRNVSVGDCRMNDGDANDEASVYRKWLCDKLIDNKIDASPASCPFTVTLENTVEYENTKVHVTKRHCICIVLF